MSNSFGKKGGLIDRLGLSGSAIAVALALSAGGAVALGSDRAFSANRVPVARGHGQHKSRHEAKVGKNLPPPPRIIAKPSRNTDLRWAYFTYSSKVKGARFECALDTVRFRVCPNHVVFGLIEGRRPTSGGHACRGSGVRGRRAKARRRCSGRIRARRVRIPRQRKRLRLCTSHRHASRCTVDYVVGAGRPLALGTHIFRVRIRTRKGLRSKPATWRWTILTKAQLEERRRKQRGGQGSEGSKQPTSPAGRGEGTAPIVRAANFSISGLPEGALYPGGPALEIPLRIFNPNPVPITVTSLSVAVASSPPGCPAEENLRIVQSNVSPANPLRVGPGETVTLPTATVSAPTIQFLDLPVNQDACKNASFPLVYSGVAAG